ncbi:MAG: glycerol-3-phosphate acyltransferase [Gemmatimonadales bacterium]
MSAGAIGWLLASYLTGAIPTSYLAARIVAGIDLRQHGSGNLGATNLFRALGWKYAGPVGLFDMAKGAVPVWVFGPQVPEIALFPLYCVWQRWSVTYSACS